MKSLPSLSSFCLTGYLLVGGLGLQPAYADDHFSDRADNGAVLSVPQVMQKLDSAGYHQVEKIKRKRDNYEVRTQGRDGERIKLHVNAHTGAILGKHDSSDDHQDSGSVFQKLMGDCNKRRCRDDLSTPPDPVSAPKP